VHGRAGFRVVLAVAFVAHALAAVVYTLLVTDPSARSAVYFGAKLVVNALPAVWIFGVERRALRIRRPTLREIAAGVLTGLVIGAFIVAFYRFVLAGRLDVSEVAERARGFGLVERFWLYAPFICLFNAGIEEYYWRWFVFAGLRRFLRPAVAVPLSALGFTLHHIIVVSNCFPDLGVVLLLNAGVFIGGCVWAYLYERFGSIYAPYVSHMLVDAGIMVVAHEILFSP